MDHGEEECVNYEVDHLLPTGVLHTGEDVMYSNEWINCEYVKKHVWLDTVEDTQFSSQYVSVPTRVDVCIFHAP